jgi:ATP-dependent Clp protease protease subunit
MSKKINMRFDVPASALAKWDKSIVAKKNEDEDEKHSINIYSTVGDYGDGSGITARIVSSVLRKADGADVTVNINSGGGDFFEGLAIHTLLSEYEGEVTVNVIGLAASAASIIALAGNKVNIAKSGFIMIHNAWTMAIGNSEDMQIVADMLSKFDVSMMKLYAKATGLDEKQIKKMMSEETWLTGDDAIEMKFAHSLLGDDSLDTNEEEKIANAALKRVDVALAKAGMPRSERRELIKELTSTPSAAEPVTPSADIELKAALSGLLQTIIKD